MAILNRCQLDYIIKLPELLKKNQAVAFFFVFFFFRMTIFLFHPVVGGPFHILEKIKLPVFISEMIIISWNQNAS